MHSREASERDIIRFEQAKKLNTPADVARMYLRQGNLTYEVQCDLKSNKEDYTRLVTAEGKVIGHWTGIWR